MNHLSVFMLYFLEIIHLLVEEINRYYQQHLDTLDEVTIQEMYSFLAISVQMRHDQKDPMKAYWSTVEQFSVCPFTER
jgi:hypothetical protein